MSKFVGSNREQRFLLPPDLRDWIPEDDLAHFVLEAVERVGMERFKVNERGSGDAQYHPRMMLALLIYCYANGIFSSRRIERATHRDIGVRFVAANTLFIPKTKSQATEHGRCDRIGPTESIKSAHSV